MDLPSTFSQINILEETFIVTYDARKSATYRDYRRFFRNLQFEHLDTYRHHFIDHKRRHLQPGLDIDKQYRYALFQSRIEG